MKSKLSKASATIKVTRQEFAIIEKALEEYYWSKDAETGDIKRVVSNMLQDMAAERRNYIVYK